MKAKLQIAAIFIFFISMVTHAQTDYSLKFDGINDRVSYASNATLNNLNGATDYTIEVWVKPNSSTASGTVVLKRYEQFALTLFKNSGDTNVRRFYFTHYNGSPTFVNTLDNVININEWNHLVVVSNSVSNTIKLYANGVDVTLGSQAALTLEASPTSSANLYLGYGGDGTHLNANIDKVRIKTTVEVIEDLQTNVTDANYTTDADTVVLLNLNEGTGTSTLNDVIGGGNAALQCGGKNSGGFLVDCSGGATGPTWTALEHIWDGSQDSDWTTAANWDTNAVPTANYNVVIPEVTTAPVISSTTAAVAKDLTITETDGITINSGGSLIASGTASGNITYNIDVADDKWHLISSPVFNESYNDTWANNNSIADGSGTNRGISTYQNGAPHVTTGPWVYMLDGQSGTFNSGVGYSLKRTGSGTYSFTGAFAYNSKTPAITQGENNWNLIGNPYASYLDIATFITENSTTNDFIEDAFDAIYVWDPSDGATGAYKDLTTGSIRPGQAFFIKSKVYGNASITEAMQTSVTGAFYKSETPSLNLILSNGRSIKKTKINYLDGKTESLDAGFDIGMFDGVDSDIRIYTHLLKNNKGIALSRQALPNTNLESLVVPVGVKAIINTEITFSAEALNFPEGLKVFLEDRTKNTFTRLDEANANYKVTLFEDLQGTGRFYLHTAQKALSIDRNTTLENISIYKADKSTLRIVGLQQGKASVKLFNVLGKQMMNSSFEPDGVQNISLPKLATGIYIVQLETVAGKLNKKIVLE
jgi:hypothetical protein